jgi:putative peptide zinc metalloprotease protein
VVIAQSDVDLIRTRTENVKLRFPERIPTVLPSSLVREVPAGTDQLPDRVLSQLGGGDVAVDPRDQRGVKAFQRIFLFDIVLPPQVHQFNVGGRVYVRFDHGLEPLVWRWYRALRELALKNFNV